MFNDILKFVKQTRSIDHLGDTVVLETERTVFCMTKSIGQSEFYQAQANGLKPEIKFVIADYLDYENELIVRYKAFNQAEYETYSVIRTYRTGNNLEIVCRRGVDE